MQNWVHMLRAYLAQQGAEGALRSWERQAPRGLAGFLRYCQSNCRPQQRDGRGPGPAGPQQWELVNSTQEFVRLAELVLVQTPSSVEEEREFSKLGWLRDKFRNRLQQEHLNVCMRMHQLPITSTLIL